MIHQLTGLLISCFLLLATSKAQTGYSNYAQQNARLGNLSKQHPQLAKLTSLTKTTGGKDIWMLTLGMGNTESKPGIVVVGGVEGNHLLGMELALGFAEKLLQASSTDSIRNLLATTSFYIFPNMSPDAMEQYFAPLRYDRQGNSTVTDDDRDGNTNEDGFDDLDNNNLLTMMRIASPVGQYRINPEDARSMIKADPTKGEKGGWMLMPEGIDNDKDGLFNEDGAGGVWFNKNFSFKHPSFSAGSGEYAVSEKETRAIADQLFLLFNVYAVVSFSSNNNLSTPIPFNAANTTTRILTGWLEPDVKVNAMVSDLYNKTTTMKDAPKSTAGGGDFLSWAYYHYGRFSFSTPGWFVPKAAGDTVKKTPADTSTKLKADSSRKPKPPSIEDATANYLRWATQQAINVGFTPWKKITHPDFPEQIVEVGGLDPFVLTNPPFSLVNEIVGKHHDFLIKMAALKPSLDMVNLKSEKLAGGITRVTLTVINRGAFPSHSALGERTYWVKRINVKLKPAANQTVISGKKIQVLNSLEGYGSRELSWLVKGTGKLTIEAGSPTTGSKQLDISL